MKEISPVISLEEMMLKLKLQHFGPPHVQEAVIKTIPKKKKRKKAKWLFEEVLQIAEKRREAKSKGENDIHI